ADVAEQHVRDPLPSRLSRIPRVDNRARLLYPSRHRHRAPADDDDDDRFPGGGDLLNQFFLMTRQPEERAIANCSFFDAGAAERDVALTCESGRLFDPFAPVVADPAVPHELQPRVAGALEVLEADFVLRSRLQLDIRSTGAEGLFLPVVDQERAVEEEPVA